MIVSTPPTDSQRQPHLQSYMSECPRTFDGTCNQMSRPPYNFPLLENSSPLEMRGSHPLSVPFLHKVKNRVGRSRIRKHHPKSGKADGMGASFLSCTVEKWWRSSGNRFSWVERVYNQAKFWDSHTFSSSAHYSARNEIFYSHWRAKRFSSGTTRRWAYRPDQIFYSFWGLSVPSSSVRRRPCRWRLLLPCFRGVWWSPELSTHRGGYSHLFRNLRWVHRNGTRIPSSHKVAIHTTEMVFPQTAVTFCGYIVDADGFRPDPELTRAIKQFPISCSIPDFAGCPENQITMRTFSPELRSTKQPLVILWVKDYPLIRGKVLCWVSTEISCHKLIRISTQCLWKSSVLQLSIRLW